MKNISYTEVSKMVGMGVSSYTCAKRKPKAKRSFFTRLNANSKCFRFQQGYCRKGKIRYK